MKTWVAIVLSFLLAVDICCCASARNAYRSGRLEKRAEDGHAHEEDGHGHEEDSHGHGTTGASTDACPVTGASVVAELMELAEKRPSLRNCTFEIHHEEEHGHEEDEHGHEEEEEHEEGGVCSDVTGIVTDLLIHLNVSTECCLEQDNISACAPPTTKAPPSVTSGRISASEAYGYGFLMVLLVCLASLIGFVIIPITKNGKLKSYYPYIYALLIALGTSALFCDAILHLIPEAFGLHDHGAEGDGHAHDEEGEEDKTILWRSLVVVLGLYAFFLFEFVLHSWTSHSLGHLEDDDSSSAEHDKTPLQDKSNSEQNNGMGANQDGVEDGRQGKSGNVCRRMGRYILDIKPLAWLIIVGDSLHNFADGLAIGAAISQSLSLGISTTIAVLFHEIPHELGDFSILLSTGMAWYVAIFFNFVSALTAMIGFFIGVAIGTNSTDANYWILGITAGVFLYLALVDLLPELIHAKDVGCARFIKFALINVGFFISFVALFLLAYYEEDLNTLVSV